MFLARNIELAIDSCKPESGNLLHNRERMQRVKESVDDGYCDISGRKENLHNIGMLPHSDDPLRLTTFCQPKWVLSRFIFQMVSPIPLYLRIL
jgi:hypothetical protein